MKQNDQNLTTAYIRTDNAGCYKGSETLLAIEQLYKLTGVFIRRFDFADAQAGKGPCDRMAAVVKSNIRRFINEKHDCVSSADFVQAARATGYLTVMECRLPACPASSKSSWSGVKNYNNIQYELVSKGTERQLTRNDTDMIVRVWRAFGVGLGQTFRWSKLNVSDNVIAPLDIGVRHDNLQWLEDNFGRGVDILPSFSHADD